VASFQTPGSSSALVTSASFDCLASKSKIPPQLDRPRLQVGEMVGDGVKAFWFHDGSAKKLNYTEVMGRAAAAVRDSQFGEREA
jgi:hypothetical protein